jgi:hypothetical protein
MVSMSSQHCTTKNEGIVVEMVVGIVLILKKQKSFDLQGCSYSKETKKALIFRGVPILKKQKKL